MGVQDDFVSVLRGVHGSVLGYDLQESHLVGCINVRNELSLISYGQLNDNRNECRFITVDDLQPSARAEVTEGLPTGSLDDAISQLRTLTTQSLLPLCAPHAGNPGVDCRRAA